MNEKIVETIETALKTNSIIINPTTELLEQLATTTTDPNNSTKTRVLTTNQILTTATNDFLTATELADKLKHDTITLRHTDLPHTNTTIITPDKLTTLLTPNANPLTTTDTDTITTTRNAYEHTFENATPASLRTPAKSTLLTTMRDELSDDIATDLETLLTNINSLPTDADIDEVATILLLAAQHEELLYDVSKWGENINLASKATFSRTKTTLEENNYIQTDKVPIEIGRPRLRLTTPDNTTYTPQQLKQTLNTQH